MRSSRRSTQLPTLPTDPDRAGQTLLSLEPKAATALFGKLPTERQLAIIEATPNPRHRESLYYLVPDCTELVRESRVEGLLEIVNTMFGTGLACGILSAVSAEQFAAMFERTAFREGLVDPEMVVLWVAELSELEPEELANLLSDLDVELLAELFRGRADVPSAYKGMLLASGIVELEQVEFDDEQARIMGELLWAADPDLLKRTLRYLLAQDEEFGPSEEEPEEETVQPEDEGNALPNLDGDDLDELLPPVGKT